MGLYATVYKRYIHQILHIVIIPNNICLKVYITCGYTVLQTHDNFISSPTCKLGLKAYITYIYTVISSAANKPLFQNSSADFQPSPEKRAPRLQYAGFSIITCDYAAPSSTWDVMEMVTTSSTVTNARGSADPESRLDVRMEAVA